MLLILKYFYIWKVLMLNNIVEEFFVSNSLVFVKFVKFVRLLRRFLPMLPFDLTDIFWEGLFLKIRNICSNKRSVDFGKLLKWPVNLTNILWERKFCFFLIFIFGSNLALVATQNFDRVRLFRRFLLKLLVDMTDIFSEQLFLKIQAHFWNIHIWNQYELSG